LKGATVIDHYQFSGSFFECCLQHSEDLIFIRNSEPEGQENLAFRIKPAGATGFYAIDRQ